MKKFYSLLAALLLAVAGVQAEDQTFTISNEGGTLVANGSSSYHYKWTSTNTDPQVTLTATNTDNGSNANNITTSDGNLVLMPGSNNNNQCFYTIAFPQGYVIKSYKITGKVKAANITETLTLDGTEQSMQFTSTSESALTFNLETPSQTSKFKLSGSNDGTNGGVVVSAIEVTYENIGTATVTWSFNNANADGPAITSTYTQTVTKGATNVTCDASYPFTTISGTITGPVNEDTKGNATANFTTLPFTPSKDFASATWFNLYSNSNRFFYYTAGLNQINNAQTLVELDDRYEWAFVGNPIDGFLIYNKAAGPDVYLFCNSTPGNGVKPYMGTTDADNMKVWNIIKAKSKDNSANDNQFSFWLASNPKVWTNTYGGAGNPLSFWDGFNDGSFFSASALPDVADVVETNIAPFYENTGYFYLNEAGRDALVKAGYSTEQGATYTEDQYHAMQAVIADINNFSFPETGYYRIESSGARSGKTYIGYGSTTHGFGLRAYAANDINSDASTVIYLQKIDNSPNTYKMRLQDKWVVDVTLNSVH